MPSGLTTGPASGDMPLLPPGFRPADSGPHGAPAGPPSDGNPLLHSDNPLLHSNNPLLNDDTQRMAPQPSPPSQDSAGPGLGAVGGLGVTGRMSGGAEPLGAPDGDPFRGPADEFGDGLAIGPGAGPGVPEEHVSGDTLVSGIPVIRPGASESPFPQGPAGSPFPQGPAGSRFPPAPPSGRAARPASGPAPSAPAKKKGRSKLVLAGAALVGVLGIAYGVGLLLDHADVPNGTMVLGVDIGGTSKEDAVELLDRALGDRADAPLTVSVGGKETELKPSVAGLGIDTAATVRAAAGRDYNPVSVIGSLLGVEREAQPAIKTDEEKLRAALRSLSGDAGTVRDATITFETGKAVPVPGQAGTGLDVERSVTAVSAAYRERATTGRNTTVRLPNAAQQPAIGRAELDRAMKEFAEPAMSGLVTVQTDPAHTIAFSPENSLPKFLSMKAIDGKLVDSYDLKTLQELYGGTFDGVLIQRGNGQKTPVTPQDVVVALREALRGDTPAERVGLIETDPR
jgi:hypothetical protein